MEPRSPAPKQAARRLTSPELRAACGGGRYITTLAIESLSSGLLRPFILLYAVTIMHMSITLAGSALTAGMVFGLVMLPSLGRWLDTGVRTAPVVVTLLVRVVGLVVLLAVPGSAGFFVAALLLGAGNQAWSPSHAAVVSSLSEGRLRDEALAATRALRNAGTGAGALVATVAVALGDNALRGLALVTAAGLVVAAIIVAGTTVEGERSAATLREGGAKGEPTRVRTPGLTFFHVANAPLALCFDVLEVALPAVLVLQLQVSPAWSSGIFIGNTVMVIALQVAVVVFLSRYTRVTSFALSAGCLAFSYMAFWGASTAGGVNGAVLICVVSAVYTLGEIAYTGSATAVVLASAPPHLLGRELARFHLSYGFGRAASPLVLTTLFAVNPALMWWGLALVTAASGGASLVLGPDQTRTVPAVVPASTGESQ